MPAARTAVVAREVRLAGFRLSSFIAFSRLTGVFHFLGHLFGGRNPHPHVIAIHTGQAPHLSFNQYG
jgi:uncharacterized membrane protein required for colicin V production